MSGKRLSKEQKEAIVRDIRAKKKSFQAISRDHSCSISTVSKIAGELGLSSPRSRTKPVDVPTHSYDRKKRISALDRMAYAIEQTVANGGLSTKQLFDLSRAAQSVYATRRLEDTEPEPEERGLLGNRGGQVQDVLDNLVDCDEHDVPRNTETYFAVLDVADSRERGTEEDATEMWEKMREIFERVAGIHVTEEHYAKMINKIQRDFVAVNGPYKGEGHA